jgi:hypothetical protein
MPHHVLSEHDAARGPQVRFHRLFDEELKAARHATDCAEQLRRDYQAIVGPGRHDGQEIADPKRSKSFENVVQAYTVVISQYAGTEIAATCAVRLAGFHTYGQDYETSMAVLKNAAALYAGTPVENALHFSLGLTYLQGKHDPEEATKWFKLIPRPTSGRARTSEFSSQHEKLYFSAQQQIAKCDALLNRVAYAQQRYERLKALLQSEDWYLRKNTARLIAFEPIGLSSSQKISLLMASLSTVYSIPGIDKKQASNMFGTQENLLYCAFIKYLSQVKGADTLLAKKVHEAEGYAQWVVKIALAQLGDPIYKSDLKAFILNPDMFVMSGMRLETLRSFAKMGTVDDTAFLEDLAGNDPFEVVFFHEEYTSWCTVNSFMT